MKKSVAYIFFLLVLFGCSNSNDDVLVDTNNNNNNNNNYLYLKVNGQVANEYGNGNNLFKGDNVVKKNGVFTINANYGEGFEWHLLKILFTADGKIISVDQESNSSENGQWKYSNFRHFPSNYFNVDTISIDENTNKLKAKLNGSIYLNKNNLNSESIFLEIDIDCSYVNQDDTNQNYIITSSDFKIFTMEQYCSAVINNVPWIARHEHEISSFTSVDPYRIEINFDNDAVPGSFPVNPASLNNYLKFSKFNTTTLTYDYFNVTGNLAYTYKEYHGFLNYSFIGTFSFTAVNPNNTSEIITVNDGRFRSYQQY